MPKRGLFIVFEGIDGCGKSTQVWKVAKYIAEQNKYNHVLVTREPYQKKEIREILKKNEAPHTQAEELANLFLEDRKKHLNELIIPALEKGVWVISDRYKFSTIAYQAAQGLKTENLINMHKGLIISDITFIIDLPAEIAKERISLEDYEKAKGKFVINKSNFDLV